MRKLTKKDVVIMLKLILDNYNKPMPDRETFDAKINLVYSRLEKYPYEVVNEAFGRCLDSCKYNISIADIIEQIQLLQDAQGKSTQDLWAELDRAIYDTAVLAGRFDYTAIPIGETKTQGEIAYEQFQELFNNLDPLIKSYLVTPQQLLALTELEDLSFEKGRFFKYIPELKTRKKAVESTRPEILDMLNQVDNAVKSLNDTKKLGFGTQNDEKRDESEN